MCLGLVAASALASGCRSSTQTDLIQREMRQQEDQIYALQDYLADYERVLCQVRSENAALREALARRESGDDLPSPSRRAPTPSSRRPSPPVPNGLPDEAEPTVPDVPPLDLPDVPPLDTSSWNDADFDELSGAPELAGESDPPPASSQAPEPEDLAPEVAEMEPAPEVVLASHDELADEPAPSPPTSVAVLGEVANDDGAHGPRVLVQVVPLAADGESTAFDGELSLMFLLPHAAGPRELARWDFSAEELPQFVRRSDAGIVFEFPLQLPPETPTHTTAEFWVRLMPTEGRKILSQTSVDLGRPGRFASGEPRLREPAVRLATAESFEPAPVEVRAVPQTREENGWQVAVPGLVQSANAASSPEPQSEWRQATQPIPAVEPRPSPPDSLDEPLDAFDRFDRYRVEEVATPEPRSASTWSPERPQSDRGATMPAPAWAPTR